MTFRWLLLVSCLLLALTLQPGFAKLDRPRITETKFEHEPVALFYFEDTETVVMSLKNGDLLQSFDGGEGWQMVESDDGSLKHQILFIRQHPFDNTKAYAIGNNGHHLVTTDQAKTWRTFDIGDFPAIQHPPLVFHGWDSSKVILQSEECAGLFCIVRSYYTTDDFKTIKLLRESAAGCSWAVGHPQFAEDMDISEELNDRSLCVVPGLKVPFGHANRLVYSDDYFSSNIEGTEVKLQEGRPVSGVISTAAVKKFIVAAVKSKGTEELALFVTTDTDTWSRAEFDGHRVEQDAYTMLESTNYSLQVDVLTSPSSSMGVLFTSNSNGTFFSRNIEHTNRDMEGTVDFEKIAGIQGIVMVNTVKNPKEVESGSEKKVISKISFDDGRSFQALKVNDENLHLHSVTAFANIGRVFSSPAPGLVMGVGNTGDHLKKYADGDLYISDDAGVSWRHALDGPHKYEFGDQGAVVMAVSDDGTASKVRFSLDHGKEWESVELEHKIYPTMVTTTPDSTSLKFVLVGKHNKDGGHVVYSIDFSGLHERQCEENDFEMWPARLDKNGEPDCLMGHTQLFRRRKANADCFVDKEFKDPQAILKPCSCTAEDFECQYKRSEDGKNCILAAVPSPPEGKCQQPTDTFMGPSGWRLIPGDTCIREGGQDLDNDIEWPCKDAGSTPADGKLSVVKRFFDGKQFSAYYYLERQSSSSGDDETIIMLTSEHVFYVSHDHGKTWQELLKGEKINKIVPHPYNSDGAFLLTDGAKGFWTVDRAQTFKPFEAPAPPTKERLSTLSFHPQYKDWLIWTGAVDCGSNDCHSNAYISKNRGENWELLRRYVQKCEFESRESRPESTNLIFCEQYENENRNNHLQLMSSDNWFSDWHVHFEDVISYATMSEFIIVASRDPVRSDSLVASSSVDGRTFAGAQFPPNVDVPVQTAYTVLESSTHAVFLHVTVNNMEGAEYGSIIKSNSNGTFYVLSLGAVNRNHRGYVDFEKMQGMEGVAIANVVSNMDKLSDGESKKLRTMITHNDGGRWSLLSSPTKDADGKDFSCSAEEGKGIPGCSLHLHGYTERRDERDTFSSGSAIGLMMGVGNVGDHLGPEDEVDTFITQDAGFTWKSVKKGRYMWEFGDAGSVIVIVPESKPTKVLYYSLDEGNTWEEFSFSDVEMQIDDISTVPSDTSKSFLLWGKELESDHRNKLATVSIDFSGLRSTSCKLDESKESHDYYIWEPKHPFESNNCLFGHVEQYHRKKPSAQCWNNWREPHVHSIGKNCSCTYTDYECDYNYEPLKDGSCGLVSGLAPPDAIAICKEDPDRIEYWELTGYRRLPQTTCEGGLNLDHVVSKPCPNKEEEYNKRHSISGVGLFFAIVTPVAVAGAVGYYAYSRWDGKFGQIRLGENVGGSRGLLSRDSLLITLPVAIIAGAVAITKALPLLAASLWRSTGGYVRNRGYSRPYASRGSFAARRSDYTGVVDDEDELLGVEDPEADMEDEL
ncbi:vacuolar protein sorting/targeting protein 10 [Aspergillus heteromorphus CBS 117.55]|uniref:Vacuolar protein sorting/targeting protein 10 n=1 Tax=Aspergillus heteromorphus CBS 117.55 TaxID=1448321 RepID=A0A317UXN0_9EURO|nr:vacuolar protein sorting/targeting protein 10 [Aspergillus heteromorphus CBS 117.55]PWY66346.1 vacuolar protein sorting/targeting protein 10 [Aspergillus heteromorphus CBS 117.55]